LLNFIDRSNIGNANVAGFSKDLKLSVPKYEYNVGLMLFYVAYVLVEIPSNLVMKKIGSIWLAMLTLGFAIVCISTAFIKNFQDFVGVRIALGLCEGGVIREFNDFRPRLLCADLFSLDRYSWYRLPMYSLLHSI
jgi:hypothetical protein